MFIIIYIHMCTVCSLKYRIIVSCIFAIFYINLSLTYIHDTQSLSQIDKSSLSGLLITVLCKCIYEYGEIEIWNIFLFIHKHFFSLLYAPGRNELVWFFQFERLSIHFVLWKMRIWLSSYSQHPHTQFKRLI